ncbi:RNA polymerase sigma factor [Sphingosinicella rhizophila]|uniref:RNA polymerase sigma factor n=1 Tax=Sphingosinicella rhizophila TaxID=3050082 RepID=A0ABU3QA23_9SPHN|nr:RNA polymerase sigma factor [Sphingosinicella sp. GR2756]MDT9600260.1 RNA polymerase sigma factor [Sphingosinicella sp. GR2756]
MADPLDRSVRARLLHYLQARTRVADEAEDIVQEAYQRLAAYPRPAEIQDGERFLWRTAFNLASSLARRRRVRSDAHSDLALIEHLYPHQPPQDEVLTMRERLRLVEQAIADLPDRAREVFVAIRIGGMTYSEAARHFDISISAIEKNMARAIALMTIKVHGLD